MAGVQNQIKSDYNKIVAGFVIDDDTFIKSLPLDRLRRAFEPHGYGLPAFHLAIQNTAVRCVKYLMSVDSWIVDVNRVYHVGAPRGSGRNMKYFRTFTPFSAAIWQLGKMRFYDENTVMIARLLAQNLDVSVNVEIDDFLVNNSIQPSVCVAVHVAKKYRTASTEALLIDISRNPSFDVNRCLIVKKLPAPGNLLLMAITGKFEDLFHDIVDRGIANISMKCIPGRHNMLHVASQCSVRSMVAKLLKLMSPDDINAVTNDGQYAYETVPDDVTEHAHIFKRFIECPKFVLDGRFLSTIIHWSRDDNGTQSAEQRVLFNRLVDDVLQHPRYNLGVRCFKCPYNDALLCEEDTTMLKLLKLPTQNWRDLRAETNDEGLLEWSLIHKSLYTRPVITSLRVFEALVKFAEMRDEIMQPSTTLGRNALHGAIENDRAEVLEVLMTCTAHILHHERDIIGRFVPTLRQWAARRPNKKCLKVVRRIERGWVKKVTPTEKGHLFDCC